MEKQNKYIIYYENDYDILYVHRLIVDKYYENKNKKIHELNSNIKLYKDCLSQDCLSKIKINVYEKNISKLQELKEILEKDEFLIRYLNQIKDILEKYKENISNNKTVFGNSDQFDSEELKERELYVDQFAERIKDFSHIILLKTDSKDYFMNCFRCNKQRVIEESIIYCEDCNIKHDYKNSLNFQSGSRKYVPIRKNTYLSVKNFIIELDKMQGKNSITFVPEIFEKLDEYFSKNNFMSAEEIRNSKMNKYGKRGPYSKRVLREALNKCNLNAYYKDIDSLTRDYWGWKLINLTNSQVNKLIRDYEESQAIFNSLSSERTSVINLEYRKFRHLINIGIKCRVSDFIIIKTPEILKEYEKMWEIVCQKLNWKFIAISDYIIQDDMEEL